MNRVMVNEGWEDEFVGRFKKRVEGIKLVEGFSSMEILSPAKEGLPHIVLTHWQSKGDFESWVGSEDFRKAHENPMPSEAFSDGGGIEIYDRAIATTM